MSMPAQKVFKEVERYTHEYLMTVMALYLVLFADPEVSKHHPDPKDRL